MKVYIIGTGNVATVLGRSFIEQNIMVTGVYGRDLREAKKLASELRCEPTDHLSAINQEADIYLIAVSDAAIAEVAGKLQLKDKIVAHTSGAVSKEVLQKTTDFYGVFYPLQSIRKKKTGQPEIPLLIDGSTQEVMTVLQKLAESISKTVRICNDEERLNLHVAAVIVSNFTNFLYTLAKSFADAHSLDFSLLHPLIREVAERVEYSDPAEMQTGPAIRSDEQTIEKHLQILQSDEQLQLVYKFLTEQIRKFYGI